MTNVVLNLESKVDSLPQQAIQAIVHNVTPHLEQAAKEKYRRMIQQPELYETGNFCVIED